MGTASASSTTRTASIASAEDELPADRVVGWMRAAPASATRARSGITCPVKGSTCAEVPMEYGSVVVVVVVVVEVVDVGAVVGGVVPVVPPCDGTVVVVVVVVVVGVVPMTDAT